MAKRKRGTIRRSKAVKVLYAIVGFLAAGLFPTVILGDTYGPTYGPRVSMVLAAAAIMPIGARSGSVLSGLLRGLGLGILAGYAISMALVNQQFIRSQDILGHTAWYTFSTAFLCGAISALFAHLTRRRALRAEEDWNR